MIEEIQDENGQNNPQLLNPVEIEEKKKQKKKGDLNFKKWLLSLSSIANLILGALLLIMGISAVRFHLSSIFIADRALIIIALIIIICSILCFIGIGINSFIILLMVFYNYILTVVVLSVFALSAVFMNQNLIDWIDDHWDIIRNSVVNYDMHKFQNHVTTEVNSLGIFSMTLNAIILVSLFCISNFLKFKNIIFALTPPLNLIFSCLSVGLMVVGIFMYQHSFYTSISSWSCVLIFFLGLIFLCVGIFGYLSIKNIKRQLMLYHLLALSLCVIALLFSCFAVFKMSSLVDEHVEEHWDEINQELKNEGYNIRKSYVINELQINLKLAGFYIICFTVFSIVTFFTSLYQYFNLHKLMDGKEMKDNNGKIVSQIN